VPHHYEFKLLLRGVLLPASLISFFTYVIISLIDVERDPFIFHWLLITLSVFILVVADLGYTFNASIDEELLKNIEWLWSFIFSIGYSLLTVSILWFNKIKQILEYKKFSESIKNENEQKNNNLDGTIQQLTL
jgi:hypothetical protein